MSDYIFMLRNRLTPVQQQLLDAMQAAAERAQVHLFLAGGAMRDLLGGFPIRDLDFCVESPALKMARALDRRHFQILADDELRQSAELLFDGSARAEIAMCRREQYSKTGGQPEITRATIQEDLLRRDLSINAIAMSLNPTSQGLLLDPANGLADLERKELRVLHNYSFFDDPARLLRLIRFKSRLGFSVEERTQTQFESARAAGVEEYVTPRSRQIELRQLAAEPAAADAVKALAAAELLAVFEPHLDQKRLDLARLERLDKSTRFLREGGLYVDSLGPFLECLTSKLASAQQASLRTRAGLRGTDVKAWTSLEARAKNLQKALAAKPAAQNSKLYRILCPQDTALLSYVLALSPLATVRERIKNFVAKLLPLAKEIQAGPWPAFNAKPGTPKFEKLKEAYLDTRLDTKVRPKPEPAKTEPPSAEPLRREGARGRRGGAPPLEPPRVGALKGKRLAPQPLMEGPAQAPAAGRQIHPQPAAGEASRAAKPQKTAAPPAVAVLVPPQQAAGLKPQLAAAFKPGTQDRKQAAASEGKAAAPKQKAAASRKKAVAPGHKAAAPARKAAAAKRKAAVPKRKSAQKGKSKAGSRRTRR